MTTPSQASEAGRLRLFAFKPQSLIISAIVCFGIPVAIAWFIISQAPLSWTNFREESNGIGVAVGIGFWLLGFWYYSTFRNANDNKGMAKVLVWAMRIALALTLVVVFMAFFAFWAYLSARANGILQPGQTWSTFMDASVQPFLSSGVPVAVVAIAAVRLCSGAAKRAVARLEPTEATWWLDVLRRGARLIAYLLTTLMAISSTMLWLRSIDPSVPIWFEGTWWQGIEPLVSQLGAAGMLQVFLYGFVLFTIRRRVILWFDVQRERNRRAEHAAKPSLELLRTVFKIVFTAAVAWLAVQFLASCFTLTNPAQYTQPSLFAFIWTACFPATAAAPLLGFALLWLISTGKALWRESAGRTHGFLNGLFTLAIVAAFLALLVELVRRIALTGLFPVMITTLGNILEASQATPNIWGYLVNLVITVVLVIVGICVALVVIVLIASGDGGGGGAGAGAGGGGGGGSSFGGGFSRDPQRQTITDRYGNKLLEVDDSGIFGPTKLRDRHGAAVGTVRDRFDSSTSVRIGDDEYRVRDAPFSSDKIVTKDDEEVGRIQTDHHGDDVFRSS